MTTAIHTCASELGRDGISAEIYDSGYMETGVTVSCNRCGEACDELISYEPAESEQHGRFGACTDDGGELCAACESRTTGDSTACDESNTYWENEEGNSAYIDLDRVITAIESV